MPCGSRGPTNDGEVYVYHTWESVHAHGHSPGFLIGPW
jgi:hypothetical protein